MIASRVNSNETITDGTNTTTDDVQHNNSAATAENDTDAQGNGTAAPSDTETDVVIPDSNFPDGTTLDDYPDAHIQDPNDEYDDMEMFVIEQDCNGHIGVQQAEPKMNRNGVKGDAFHIINAYKRTIKKKHGMYPTFCGLLRDAIFMVDPDEMERERQKLSDALFTNPQSRCHNDREKADNEAKRRLYCPGSKVLQDKQRVIPPPSILLPRVKKAVELCANAKDAATGEILFSKQTWNVHVNACLHFDKGCYSDKPGFRYYYFTTSKTGKQQLMCVRGTSALEGFHKHLRRIFPGFHTAPLLATCLLALFVYRWNMDRAVERGLIPEEYADWYEHELVVNLQQLAPKIAGVERLHDDFLNCEDFLDTGETFYTPIVRLAAQLQEERTLEEMSDISDTEEDAGDMSASMEFAAQRDQEQQYLPITPVLPCERAPILELCNRYVSTRRNNTNQYGSIDFDAALVEWNSLCSDEMAKPLEARTKMFPKTAGLLRNFYNDELKRENERRTMRQIVHIQNHDQVTHPVVASRGIQEYRHELQQEATREMIPDVRTQPVPLQRPTTVAQGQGDSVALPPIELNAATRNVTVMEAVRDGRHLNVPFAPAVPAISTDPPIAARQFRCYRCGLHKNGPHHMSKKPKNSVEYCTVPEGDRFPGWIVPAGYEINDNRKPEGARSIKRKWKRHKEANGIVDHTAFQDW
jgi:hypothetical protein